MNNFFKTFIAFFVLVFLCGNAVFSQISQFRGVNRDGQYPGNNLLAKWPDNGPALKWFSEEVGSGFSAPIVFQDNVYITGTIDSTDYLTAFDKTGKKLWQVSIGAAWKGTFPDCRTTPTITNDGIYIINSFGKVLCINAKDGKEKWVADVKKDFEGVAHEWGNAESLLLVENKVIVAPAGQKTTFVALDKNTGKVIWQSVSLKDTSNYCSPIAVKYQGKNIIFSALNNNIYAVDAADGKILCTYNVSNDQKRNPMKVNTPLFKDGKVFIAGGYDCYSYMLEISKDLKQFNLVWKDTIVDSEYGYVVEKDGYIYSANYINARKGNWCCAEWATGKVKYETEWETKGTLSMAGDKLICMDEKKGKVALVKVNPAKFEIISQFQLPKGKGPCWANPVIDNGSMFVRRGSALMVYNVSN